MDCELGVKWRLLEAAGFKYHWPTACYLNRVRKTIISSEMATERSVEWLMETLEVVHLEWTFYFKETPSSEAMDSVLGQLNIPFRPLHTEESLCREVRPAIEGCFDEIRRMAGACVTVDGKDYVAVTYIMPAGAPTCYWTSLAEGRIVHEAYYKPEGAGYNLRKITKSVLHWRKLPEYHDDHDCRGGYICARFAVQVICD